MFCISEGALTSKTKIDSHWGVGVGGEVSELYIPQRMFQKAFWQKKLRMQTRGYLLR